MLGLSTTFQATEVKDVVLLRKNTQTNCKRDATSKPYENVYGDFIVKSKKIDAGDKDDNDEVKALVFKAEEIGVYPGELKCFGRMLVSLEYADNKQTGSKICSLGSFNDMIDAIEAGYAPVER